MGELGRGVTRAFQIAKLFDTLPDTILLLQSACCSFVLVRVSGGNRQTERGRLQGNLGRS